MVELLIVRPSARDSEKVSDVMFAPKAISFGAALRKSAPADRAASMTRSVSALVG
jgi:hypothetical protein